MRIAFLVGEFPSISETFILSQITGLIDLGHHVDIYAIPPKQEVKKHSDIDKYNLSQTTFYHPKISKNIFCRIKDSFSILSQYIHINPKTIIRSLNIIKYGKTALSLRLLHRLVPFLEKNSNYDIIHCHHGSVALIGAKLIDIKAITGSFIVSFHGYDVNVLPQLLGKDIYKHVFKTAERITVNSQFTSSKLTALGCPKDKIVYLPVGLDLSKYRFKIRKLPSKDKSIEIITVARLVEKKGIEYSIQAVSNAISQYSNIQYKIIGNGPLFNPLKNKISSLNRQDKIHLLGWKTKEEVQRLYEQAHIFILSSITAQNNDSEGQGLVLQEAQAVGLPVIATLHNGFPDSVLDGKSAFLVPERSVDSLAERLKYLIHNPQSWPEMGSEGRAYVENNFDINDLNIRLVEIYQSCLDIQPSIHISP